MRLAACSRKLYQDASRCQALWDHALAHGERCSPNYRVQVSVVKALTVEEAPWLSECESLQHAAPDRRGATSGATAEKEARSWAAAAARVVGVRVAEGAIEGGRRSCVLCAPCYASMSCVWQCGAGRSRALLR